MIISFAIESRQGVIECRTGNVELRSLVLVLFGSTYACYKNRDQLCINDLRTLYQMAEFLPSTFIISCSTFDLPTSAILCEFL